ncbi:hypothetical protein [Streptomyces sp. NBC_01565]|uniref:hypothetical protein n=1 Tax=unclassified Streptomyces TaxID=2593676 RepID=UPI00225AD9B7|nr:hypothetical protein [Streptomyces sp. NBC_01565]MCX4546586.1 hypothetical protein [Streptomyces sp. NBC_01565]
MANVMSPIVAERIWALPLSGSAVKFLQYLVSRYETPESMEAAFRAALARIQAGDLPNLKLPTYHQAPPTPTGRPKLQVA